MKSHMLAVVIVALTLHAATRCQVSYDDVAVIVNTNSVASQAIGDYFRAKRNIPLANMIYVHVDTTEEIDSTKFNILRSQVEDQLILNNLQHSVNYLVTTKGVPLKVNRGFTFSQSSPSASVESELMLVLGSRAQFIGGEGPQMNPYFNQNVHFSRAAFGMYLVTRLDAYTVQQVYQLIDRSGPNLTVDASATILLDQDPTWSSPLNTYMTYARNMLAAKGRSALLDSTAVYQTGHQYLLGYMSWGSNDHYQHLYTQHAIPHNTYAPGALAETYVSTSGRSFDDPPQYGQSLIVDLLAEGVSGAKGYVYEPFSNAMAHAYILYDRYTSGYNLAESYFMASLMISWMDVIVGDPKTSVIYTQAPLPVQLAGFAASLLPSMRGVEFRWQTLSERNNYGFMLQRADTISHQYSDVPNSFVPGQGTTLIPQEYSWVYAEAPWGTYAYRLRQIDLDGTSHFSEPIVVRHAQPTGVTAAGPTGVFRLQPNVPNPFNPTTAIRYELAEAVHVSLVVYDGLGRKVVELVNGMQDAGFSSVEWNASNVASGVYLARFTATDATGNVKLARVMKLVLTK